METIDVRELRERPDEVLRRVREDKETIEVADAGRVVARITPVDDSSARPVEVKLIHEHPFLVLAPEGEIAPLTAEDVEGIRDAIERERGLG